MCIFDIVMYIGCSHLTVRQTACEESRSSTPLTPCEYKERSWESADICRSSLCAIHIQAAEAAREAAAAEAESNMRRHSMCIRPVKVNRRTRPPRTIYKYTTPVADYEPRLLKYGGEYNLDIHKLYNIQEAEELAIDDVHSDPGRWSWTLHNANAVELTKATATQVTIINPKTMKHKPLPPPVALRATLPSYTGVENLAVTPCLTSSFDSAALWQAHELAKATRVPSSTQTILHPIPLRVSSKGQTDTEVLNLTPRRTSHYGSPAHWQAQELATTKRVLPRPKTMPLAIPRRVSSMGKTITEFLSLKPHRKSHFGNPARAQTKGFGVKRRVTISQHAAEVPGSLHDGQIEQSFVGHVATWQDLNPSVTTRRLLKRYRRFFGIGPGVALAPRMAVRLSAVGLSEMGTCASFESDIPIVYADIVEAKKEVKPAPILRRVKRMTLAFDRSDFARVEDTDGKLLATC